MKKVRANSNPKDPAVLTNELELHVKPHRVFHDSVPTTGHGRASSPRSGQRPVSGSGANPKKTRHTPRDSANGDLKLHIGGGNVISYRWVTRTVAKPIHGGTVLEAMEALNGSQKAMGLPTTNHEPFLLVALPGLFMTLDSMERGLGGLLEHNNRGKLLLVSSRMTQRVRRRVLGARLGTFFAFPRRLDFPRGDVAKKSSLGFLNFHIGGHILLERKYPLPGGEKHYPVAAPKQRSLFCEQVSPDRQYLLFYCAPPGPIMANTP